MPHFRQKVGGKAVFVLDITVPKAEIEPLYQVSTYNSQPAKISALV